MGYKYIKMKIGIVSAIILCTMTSCTQKPYVQELNSVKAAETDTANIVSEEENESVTNDEEDTVEKRNLEVLANCGNLNIDRTLAVSENQILLINAAVDVEDVERVSQYEYVLKDISEETRSALFEAVFADNSDKAEYDERNDVWTLEIPTVTGYEFLYQISYSNGGTTIPGEQIMVLENMYYNLRPFDDNRIDSLSDCQVKIDMNEIVTECGQVTETVTGTNRYELDYIQAYGNNGRRPYYKIMFKYMLDGMSVTTYNNLMFWYDDNGIERFVGSLFSAQELGLDQIIFSPEEAVEKLQEQAEQLSFEESRLTVSRISLEYLVNITSTGDVLITPIWRFWLGENEDMRSYNSHRILAVDAITGELIWEERGETM